MRLLFLIIILNYLNCFSLDVAISEYYNASRPQDEWIELIILEDNIDLSGYFLFDNAGGRKVNGWVGGVKFTDNPIWQNLPKGTIIVINSRGDEALDSDPSDGYIEISTENNLYFEKVINSGNNWSVAFNISQDGELFALLHENGYEHIFGHNPNYESPGVLDSILNQNTLIANGRIKSEQSVVALASINSEYSSTYGSNLISFSSSTVSPSKGLPNSNSNSDLWRSLREPIWENPNLDIDYSNDSLRFSLELSQAVESETSGYLLVSYENSSELPEIDLPVDGKIYNSGSQIGDNGIVLKHLDYNDSSTSIDREIFKCGSEYTFRLFPFRFSEDDLNADTDPEHARGRSYNQTSYASANYTFELPLRPKLIANDNNYLCTGSNKLLEIDINPKKVEWYLNGNLILNNKGNTLDITSGGRYSAKVYSESDCELSSNEILIEEIQVPIVHIEADGDKLTSDTIDICKNNTVKLSAKFDQTANLYWFRFGSQIASGSDEIIVSEEGDYFFKAINEAGCTAFSDTISINIKDYDLSFESNTLTYLLTDPSEMLTIEIINNASSSFKLEENLVESTSNIEIRSSQFPLYINANSNTSLSFNFNASQSEDLVGAISIFDYCKSTEATIKAQSSNYKVELSNNSLSFTNTYPCEISEYRRLTISESKNIPFQIVSAKFLNDKSIFKIKNQNINYPISVKKSEFEFEISFEPIDFGDFSDTLIIQTASNSNLSNLQETKIILSGTNDLVDFDILDADDMVIENIDLGELLRCGISDLSYEFKIQNTGTKEITINHSGSEDIAFTNLPLTLSVGESSLAGLIIDIDEVSIISDFSLSSDLCELSKTISYQYKSTNISANITNNNIDFGNIYKCDELSSKSFSLPVFFSGNSNELITIKNIDTDYNFDISGNGVSSSFVVNDTAYFNFSLKGDFPSSPQQVKIDFVPCGEIEFKVLANFVKVQNISSLEDSSFIDFSLANVSELKSRSITFANPYSDTLTIENHNSLNSSPFSILGEDLEFPMHIPPNSNYSFYINYLQDSYEIYDTTKLAFQIIHPCKTELNYTLIGNTPKQPLLPEVTLEIPPNLIVDLSNSKTFTIPLILSSGDFPANQVELYSLTLMLEYDTQVFDIIEDIIESRSDNSSIYLKKENYGVLIEINFSSPALLGEVLTLKAEAVLNSTYITEIRLTIIDAKFDGKLKFNTKSSSIRKIGYTNASLIFVESENDYRLKSGSILQNGSYLYFLGNNSFMTSLTLLSYHGSSETLLSTKAIDKTYRIRLDAPIGMYFLKYQVGSTINHFRIFISE